MIYVFRLSIKLFIIKNYSDKIINIRLVVFGICLYENIDNNFIKMCDLMKLVLYFLIIYSNFEISLPILIHYLTDSDKLAIKCVSKNIHGQNIFFMLDSMKVDIPVNEWYYNNITHLEITDVITYFPKSLQTLKFHNFFNEPWTTPLPDSLKSLQFGFYFNQPWETALPTSLKDLYFGCCFNQPWNTPLPASLTSLYFGCAFNHAWATALPDSLTSLHFGCEINHGKPHYPIL